MPFFPRSNLDGLHLRNAWVNKLARLVDLSADDMSALVQAPKRVRDFGPHLEVVQKADRGTVFLVLAGFAARYRQLKDGKRHILAYFLPGDHFDALLLGLDGVASLSSCRIGFVTRASFQDMLQLQPRIAEATALTRSIEEATCREWLLSLGARSALERTAHLFCELFVRLEAAGLVHGESYYLPVSQADLGSTLGLSPVHMNRMLQDLRQTELIGLKGRTLVIKDRSRLTSLAKFTPDYLRPTPAARAPPLRWE